MQRTALTRDEFVERSTISYLTLNKLEEFGLIQPSILAQSKSNQKYYSLQDLDQINLVLKLTREEPLNLRDAYAEARRQLDL